MGNQVREGHPAAARADRDDLSGTFVEVTGSALDREASLDATNLVRATIAAVSIGIGVDFAINFIA